MTVPDYLALAERALTRYDESQRASANRDEDQHVEPVDFAFAEPYERELLEDVLKGTAIALYCDLVQDTLWIVADEEDARLLGERRGVVYTADEVRLVAKIDNAPEVIRAIHEFKSTFNVAVKPPDD